MNLRISILLFISVILSSAAMAQVSSLPPRQLTTLKTRFEKELRNAREPIQAQYVASLEGMVNEVTKSGDLDGALAVQRELNAAKGKGGEIIGGNAPAQLTALKAKYDAALKSASEKLQSSYIEALEALQDSFTKAGNLPAALEVRREVTVTKSGASRGDANTSPDAELLGSWSVSSTSKWTGVYVFEAGGAARYIEDNGRVVKGKWTLVNGKLLTQWNDRSFDQIKLPPVDGRMTGETGRGYKISLKKKP